MAENGQFAIHLPLTSARVGPFSTHTAHPEFVSCIESVFRTLLSYPDLTIENPYLYMTKAEVVRRIPEALRPSIPKSVSCWKGSRVKKYLHCGECIPCIARRIALESNGLSYPEYAKDLFAEDVGGLDPDNIGKRNMVDLLEFVFQFRRYKAKDMERLALVYPELFNNHVDRGRAIQMYARFATEANSVLSKYPKVMRLMR
jgi:hypothetical protein